MKRKHVVILMMCVMMISAVALTACTNNDQAYVQATVQVTPAATAVPGATGSREDSLSAEDADKPEAYVSIEIAHGITLQYPVEYAGMLSHKQEKNGEAITETFSMKMEGIDTQLYQIHFGNEKAGEWLGTLLEEGKEVPVTYTIFLMSSEELDKREAEFADAYYLLLDSVNDALSSILADDRLVTDVKNSEVSDNQNKSAGMLDWSVYLQEGMSWSEFSEAGNDQVVFYGNVQEERFELFTVHIGTSDEGNPLGMYNLNGENKTVYVEVHELGQHENWSDDDYDAAYELMETVNTIVDAIVESENFQK